MPPRLRAGEMLVCATAIRRWSSSTPLLSPVFPSVKGLLAKRELLMSKRASARADNLSRVRELLQLCTVQERRGFLPEPQLHQRRNVWPAGTPAKSSFPSLSSNERIRKAAACGTPRFPSSSALHASHEGVCPKEAADALNTPSEDGEKRLESSYGDSPCWYGAPPGAWMNIAYLISPQRERWNKLFRDLYHSRHKPTAPLLRCPVCAAHKGLSGGVASPSRVKSVGLCGPQIKRQIPSVSSSSPLWMDPAELQRHLSYIHADTLFTPQELKLYNAQVLHELRYSCGLASICETIGERVGAAVAPGGWKTQPARLILVADVANVELGFSGELLEMLLSPKLLRFFSDFPVAVCATHELFVPVTSKTLHTLYQLASRHPASTLHVFFANTSLESGDLLTSSYLNDVLLTSQSRIVPPVVLLTGDLQQQRALTELHGISEHGVGNGGQVHWVKPLTAAQLVTDLYTALESSQCLL